MASRPTADHAGAMTENPTQSVPPQSTSFLDDSFARLRNSGYQRDTDGRWFGGVCSGLAQRFGVDPVLIRAAAVVLAFLGGIGLTAYVILWLLLPDRRGDILAERAVRQGDAGPIALLVLAAFLVIGGVFSIGNGNGWFAPLWLIPVAAIGWLVLSRRDTRSPQTGYGSVPAPPPSAPLTRALRRDPAPAPGAARRHPRPRQERPCPPPRPVAAPPMASAPTQTPAAPYAGASRRLPRTAAARPAGQRADRPVRWPAHPAGPAAPGRPRPRRRARGAAAPARSSAWCRSASRWSGIGPRCGPGRPARLPGQLGHPRLPHRPDRCVGRRAHPRPHAAGPPASAASSSWCSP